MTEAADKKRDKAARRALATLGASDILCRSHRSEAGFEYFVEPGHRPFPETSAAWLIEKGLVTPREDGLFPGMSQTFAVPAHG